MQKDAAQVKGNLKLNKNWRKGNQKLNRNSCSERCPKVKVNQKLNWNSCAERGPKVEDNQKLNTNSRQATPDLEDWAAEAGGSWGHARVPQPHESKKEGMES